MFSSASLSPISDGEDDPWKRHLRIREMHLEAGDKVRYRTASHGADDWLRSRSTSRQGSSFRTPSAPPKRQDEILGLS